MISNYLKIALRNLRRQKAYTFLNVIGLSIGIASCLLIFLLVQHELSYNTFLRDREQVYRVVSVFHTPDGIRYSGGVPFPVSPTLRAEFPQMKEVGSIFEKENVQITVPGNDQQMAEKKFKEAQGVFFTEPQFLSMFSLSWLAGNPENALVMPNTAVLTKTAAEKYFEDWKEATGRSIRMGNSTTLLITGVVNDLPQNTDFPLQVLVSSTTFTAQNPAALEDWISVYGNNECFIRLAAGTSPQEINLKLAEFVRRHKPPEYVKTGLELQPLTEMHFDTRMSTFGDQTVSKDLLGAFVLIALFLLVMACMNFINLATAQSTARSREMGVRKVLGSGRRQIIQQFLSETAMIVFISLIVALGIVEFFLPSISTLLKESIRLDLIQNRILVPLLLTLGALVTIVAGLYPALVLSGFSPLRAIRNTTLVRTGRWISVRRILVVVQFIIAQVLIVCMLVVTGQMDFFRNAPMGFDKGNVLLVPIPNDTLSQSRWSNLENRIVSESGVTGVSLGAFTPADNTHWQTDFNFDHSPDLSSFNADLKWADPRIFSLYEMPFVAGRPYRQSDTLNEFVVNETFAKKLGFSSAAAIIGKQLSFWKGDHVGPIVGVVKDFHSRSLAADFAPVVLGCWRETYGVMSIKIQPQQGSQTLARVRQIWEEVFPDVVYDAQFLDQKIENFYQRVGQLSLLYQVFAFIAILVSCLGVYGLVSFSAERRTKEIGVRKVLGASVWSVISLFSREFMLMVGIAFVIAGPFGYFLMSRWLENYAFHISLGIDLFLTALVGSLVIAWMAVGYRALRAALANPVEALRYE